METKGVNEAQQKVASLLSLSEHKRQKYMSGLQEAELSELLESRWYNSSNDIRLGEAQPADLEGECLWIFLK